MSKLYGEPQPILLDEELLQKAVMEQAPHDQAASIAKAEGIHFNEVLKIRLEYSDILKIDHLWDFTVLARLDLNNNLIERIEGLDHLINLTWLNLSFNRIQKIEGLESLKKLELLNLSNNKISVIENIDKLEKLAHFCIANNLIAQLDNVLYLRKFKNLFALNLSGNPVSEDEDYKLYIAAYFPNLTCLDNRILTEKMKHDGAVKYNYVLEEMRRQELQKQQAKDAEQCQKDELQLHKDAFVEFLNGSFLFKSMIRDDPEAQTLHNMTEVANLLQTFEQKMLELCMQLFETGLTELKRREAEVNSFFCGRTEAVTDYQQKASQILAHFEQQHKETTAEFQQLSDPDILRDKISHYRDEINQFRKSLMSLEFQMVSQLEEIIKKLDVTISDMIGNFIETAQGIFVQCRELEDEYHQKVKEIIVETQKKVANDDEDVPDDIRMLFTDNRVMDALATGHDNHLLKINDRETLLLTRVNVWKVGLIKGIQDQELKRNRMSISDTHRYADMLIEQLEELL